MSNGLSVIGLAVERSGKPVIHGVDVEIAPGKITALLGANGAGKSSLVLTIAGALPATRGQILLDGKSINGMRPEYVRRLGVVAVPEGHRVLTELTVEENLRVAGTALGRRELDGAVERAMETFPELKPRYTVRAGALSGGQQQMLVLGQAIVSQPRYILADELSFGLAPMIVARLVPVLEAFAAKRHRRPAHRAIHPYRAANFASCLRHGARAHSLFRRARHAAAKSRYFAQRLSRRDEIKGGRHDRPLC